MAIRIERDHALGLDEARNRAEQLAAKLAQKFDVRYRWEGNTLAFKRSGADGKIEVAAHRIAVLLNLGLMLAPLSGTIRGEIEKTLDQWLEE
ncbi:polyhydroxyalkanoic acid system family protein [Atopomonas sediminilitoris]|uniref:polyhydroxyalkanoic acid system family protein n=1 Tax=Atopomonas sediminilitoris TaxID=2919919 RepID=UPI001F4D8091|nr:polyhydroxyalkanoic acid system family protein [Atopomonas sediminilitoris]MCJ8168302.1 polyhydroxyalkanoic acid system family protein [Atopomonas sediminilitoris]